MTANSDDPQTLQAAIKFWSDPVACDDYLRSIRWPTGVVRCLHCDSNKVTWMEGRRKYQCNACRKQFSMTVGTIYESSKVKLEQWFLATWLLAGCRNGVSSYEIARHCGVTQKTAWFMEQRIRTAMELGDGDKFDGPAEADASYIGGKAANMHKARRERVIRGRGATGKAIVHGVMQRGEPSQVRADVVGADDSATLVPAVRRQVRYGGTVYTDAAASYGELAFTHWHQAIDHTQSYVRGAVHTNGLENFWSCLKRALAGTYIAVAPFHLFRYTAEQVFRFNHRLESDFDRFAAVVASGIGRRLTYRVLTAKNDAGFMGIK